MGGRFDGRLKKKKKKDDTIRWEQLMEKRLEEGEDRQRGKRGGGKQ